MTDGASPGVRLVLAALLRGEGDAVLAPVPQYPLYAAAVALLGGSLAPYELDEAEGWGLDAARLAAAAGAARAEGKVPRALVFINPGNPTGQCLSRGDLEALIK